LTREQAIWLCKAILTHYRSDGSAASEHHNNFDIFNRVHKSAQYKRGRDWVVHPVGYDLKEVWYGTEKSGFREAWAALVALPISRTVSSPEEFRTYSTYGLVYNNELSIAVYRVTEVMAVSNDQGFLKYVRDCFARLVEDISDVPEYDPKKSGRS
jgi:hypothetical protein